MAQLTAGAVNEYVPATCFALIHLGLGEREEALRWLDKHVISAICQWSRCMFTRFTTIYVARRASTIFSADGDFRGEAGSVDSVMLQQKAPLPCGSGAWEDSG